jgi:hypothetical protein
MDWTSAPRYIADFLAYRMLMVPDAWRPVISDVLTWTIWIDMILLTALLALYAYAP